MQCRSEQVAHTNFFEVLALNSFVGSGKSPNLLEIPSVLEF